MIQIRRAFDPRTIKLVIFDLDGTLIDSRLDLVHSVNAALRHIGRPELPDDVIASYVGDGAPILIQRALGGEAVDEAIVRQGLQFFLSYYREHKLDHTTVYAGIHESLSAIQNSFRSGPNGDHRKESRGDARQMAVLTNKPVVLRRELRLRPAHAAVEPPGCLRRLRSRTRRSIRLKYSLKQRRVYSPGYSADPLSCKLRRR